MTTYLQDKVQTLARREAVFIAPQSTLREAARLMWVESIGALVVGDDPHHALGVISERDVMAQIGQGADLDTTTAQEAMTRYVVTAQVGDRLSDAASLMLDGAIRHLPVVDGEGAVIGMLSVRDLLRPLMLDALGG